MQINRESTSYYRPQSMKPVSFESLLEDTNKRGVENSIRINQVRQQITEITN